MGAELAGPPLLLLLGGAFMAILHTWLLQCTEVQQQCTAVQQQCTAVQQ